MSQLVTLTELSITLNHKKIFDDITLNIPDNKVIGLVGKNGSGKTTLLNIISGKIEIDSGRIDYAQGIKIGYLNQNSIINSSQNIYDYIISGIELGENEIEIKNTKQEIAKFLRVFKLDKDKLTNELSGGQQKRVEIIKSIISEPDLLIFDEPTNHLDFEAVFNLQEIIKSYSGTILIVSHDRYFLDEVCDQMIEIYNKNIYLHEGGYSNYIQRREKRFAQHEAEDAKREQILKKELEWVMQGAKARETKNKFRLERYEEMKKIKKFVRPKEMKSFIPPSPFIGNKIVNLKNLTIKRDGKTLINNFDYKFDETDKIGVIGANGSGKSTLLKTILGEFEQDAGTIKIGQNTIINYLDQEKASFNPQNDIIHEVFNGSMTREIAGSKVNVYAYLKKFLFDKDSWEKNVTVLSGGEITRLLLSKLFQKQSNFLILDEPTNDLDIDMLEVFEKSLNQFDGCFLLVSHDRYFLENVCNKIFYLDGTGHVTISTGGYKRFVEEYLEGDESKLIEENFVIENKPNSKVSMPKKSLDKKSERIKRDKIRKLEKAISNLESEIKSMEFKFLDPTFLRLNKFEMKERYQELEELRESLSSKEEELIVLL